MQARVLAEQYVERLQFRQAPLAFAAVWFAAGVLIAHFIQHLTVQIVVSLVALTLLAIVGLRTRVAMVGVAAVWVALGVAAGHWQPIVPSQAELLGFADGLSRTVRGRVVRVHLPPPLPDSDQTDRDPVPPWEQTEVEPGQSGRFAQIDLEVDEVEQVTPDTSAMKPVPGGIRLAVFGFGPQFSLNCGDRIQVPLRLKAPQRFETPGAFDNSSYLLGQGIGVYANTDAIRLTKIGAAPPGLKCRLYALQQWASSRFLSLATEPGIRHLPNSLRLSEGDVQMLNAMLFGDRSGLNHGLRTGFERTGTFHLFVVSGLHIALVAAGLYWLLHRLRAPPWLATLLTIVGATAYAALTGFGQPAQRALLMTSVFLLTRLLRRERDSLNALGAAVLVMLVVAPSSLFDASFQMTALVILAIAGIAVPLAGQTVLRHQSAARLAFVQPRRVFDPRQAQFVLMLELWGESIGYLAGRRSRKVPARVVWATLWLGELVLISLVAELVMVLPMAAIFHRLPIFAVPANILILPVIGILIPLAILTFLASLVSAKLATIPAAVTAGLLHAIRFAIHALSGLQAADLRIPGPVWMVAFAAVVAWLGCVWMVRRSQPGAAATALALLMIAVGILLPEPAIGTSGALEVTAIDVGQGDSLLVVNPAGQTMLVDAGGPVGSRGVSEVVSNFDIGEQVVAPYLWSRRLRRLDVMVLTHAHTDHMGGMKAVLEDLRPHELWVGADPDSALYRALLQDAARLGILIRHVHAGDGVDWGPVRVDVLAPAVGYVNQAAPRNDDSVVLHLGYGKASVLLEGDAERPSEDAMLRAGLLGPVTLLKVGHHGSKTSSNPEFLAATRPEEAVISVGRNNTFGHPKPEVVERFAAEHTRLFRTDDFGTVSFILRRDGTIEPVDIGLELHSEPWNMIYP
jgi:competence protein ComEC